MAADLNLSKLEDVIALDILHLFAFYDPLPLAHYKPIWFIRRYGSFQPGGHERLLELGYLEWVEEDLYETWRPMRMTEAGWEIVGWYPRPQFVIESKPL